MLSYTLAMFALRIVQTHGMLIAAVVCVMGVCGRVFKRQLARAVNSTAQAIAANRYAQRMLRMLHAGALSDGASVWDIAPKSDPGYSRGETACRRIVEAYFGKPFASTRPDFLRNQVTGKSLEIDCYNEDLKLGVEYNGRQHYMFTPAFHKNYEDFLNQRYRDYVKELLCRIHGVELIKVPYTRDADIETYLTSKLEDAVHARNAAAGVRSGSEAFAEQNALLERGLSDAASTDALHTLATACTLASQTPSVESLNASLQPAAKSARPAYVDFERPEMYPNIAL